jgi:phage tail sheath gpL-like
MSTTSTIYIAVSLDQTPAQTVQERYLGKYDAPRMSMEKLRALFENLASGLQDGKVQVFIDKGDGTQATGAIACTQASFVAGTDTLTIGDALFSCVSSPSSDPSKGEFAALTNNTTTGAALAAAINAHPKLKGWLTAVNSNGTVTWTATEKGTQGNHIRMVKTGNGMSLTQPTAGAIGTVQAQARHYRRGK